MENPQVKLQEFFDFTVDGNEYYGFPSLFKEGRIILFSRDINQGDP
jgi:hypothetical protein